MGRAQEGWVFLPSSITSLSLFSPLCEIAFLINVPVPVPDKANIPIPETYMSALGNEWQLSSWGCETRATFTCSLTQTGPESQIPGYDVHRPIVHIGDLQRPLISEQVNGQRFRSRQRPSAKARTIPFKASVSDGKGQGLLQCNNERSGMSSTEGQGAVCKPFGPSTRKIIGLKGLQGLAVGFTL